MKLERARRVVSLLVILAGTLAPVRLYAEPAAPAVETPATQSAPAERARPEYTRTAENAEARTMSLELAIRTLQRPDGTGPVVHLVSAVHVADAAFYKLAQEYLDKLDVVLYEGVKPPGADAVAADATDAQRVKVTQDRLKILAKVTERYRGKVGTWPRTMNELVEQDERFGKLIKGLAVDGWNHPITIVITPAPTDRDGSVIGEEKAAVVSRGSDDAAGGDGVAADLEVVCRVKKGQADEKNLQQQLADALGLSFQLDHVNTSKPNWRNSDMSIDEVQQRLQAAGADADMLLSILDGKSGMAKLAGLFLGFIKLSPQMQTMTKIMMLEVLGSTESPLAQAGKGTGPMANLGPMMQVILHDRNQVVVRDIKAIFANEPKVKSVAAFYGAAHLADLELQLVDELGLKAGESTWVTAITVDLKKVGMTMAQAKQMRESVRRQVKSQMGK